MSRSSRGRPVRARCSNGIGRMVASLVLATAFAGLSLAALPLVAASPALASTGSGSGFCSAYGGVSSSGVQFDNVYPCANPNISDSFGYQCVEYSVRFEAVVYGVAPSWAGGPGADVVNELRQHGVPASSPNGSSAGSSAGPDLPAPGDVISMWGPGQDPAGHTGVVVAVNVSNGTGSITYYDENGWQSNGVSRGYDVISVNPGGWSDNMGSSFDYTVFNWTLQATSTPTVAAALVPGSKAGYSLNGDGTLTPFGGAPAATQAGHQWPDWDIARSVAILPNGSGGYVLDGWGGIHPFAIGANPMPPATSGGPYWSGWDIARSLVLLPNGTGGYVLDGWGGLHPFAVGSNPMPTGTSGGPYWKGWDIARAAALNPAGTGGYVLDGYGGVHPFAIGGNPSPPAVHAAYWPNWDIARAIVIDFTGTSGYTLDGYGGMHPFYADGTPVPPAPQVSDYTSRQDLARAVVLYQATQAADHPGGASGVVLDARSATPHPFTTGADGRAVAFLPGSSTAGYSLSGDGTLTPFGGAPAATQTGHQWPNWDIARGLVLLPNGTGGYVLDGYGGVHPFAVGSNPMPAGTSGGPYWNGWDIARGLVLLPNGTGGYVLDGYGGIHPFAVGSNPAPPAISPGAYYGGWDVMDGLALGADGTTAAVVDSHDGVHLS